jgi:predicted nucleic acid-binding protein
MNLPFLRYLPGLGSPPTRQVVAGPGSSNGPATAALHYLLAELPELLLAAVLDLPAGQLLATYAADRAHQPSLVAGAVATAIRQAALLRQEQDEEELAELLLTLPSQLHLVRLRPGGQQALYLAIGSHDTNLALARQLAENAVQLLAAPIT